MFEMKKTNNMLNFGEDMERKFDLLIFDLDGTLIDNRVAIREAFNYALKSHGYLCVEDSKIDHDMGLPIEKMFKRIIPDINGQTAKELAEVYREKYVKISHKGVILLDGVPEILIEMRNLGFKLAVATTKADFLVAPLLEKIGLLIYFDIVTGSNNKIRNKPNPDMLFYVMQKLNINPERAVMIGDTFMDVATANKARIPCIGVLTSARLGMASEEDLKKAKPTVIINSLRDVLKQVLF
jgi:phosphoglycolate phosphatase